MDDAGDWGYPFGPPPAPCGELPPGEESNNSLPVQSVLSIFIYLLCVKLVNEAHTNHNAMVSTRKAGCLCMFYNSMTNGNGDLYTASL